MSKVLLRQRLNEVLYRIETQLDEMAQEAQRQDINPYQARDMQGNYIIAPMLLAKAQALAGLAYLEKDK